LKLLLEKQGNQNGKTNIWQLPSIIVAAVSFKQPGTSKQPQESRPGAKECRNFGITGKDNRQNRSGHRDAHFSSESIKSTSS
jgi:hypothetical protein